MYPMDGLRLLAFHRRVLGPVAVQQLFDVLAGKFALTQLTDPGKAAGCFALYVGGRWYDALFTGKRDQGAAGLDVAVLDRHVLAAARALDPEPAADRLRAVAPARPRPTPATRTEVRCSRCDLPPSNSSPRSPTGVR